MAWQIRTDTQCGKKGVAAALVVLLGGGLWLLSSKQSKSDASFVPSTPAQKSARFPHRDLNEDHPGGHWRLSNLQPGTYRLYFSAPQGSARASYTVLPGVMQDDLQVQLRAPAPVHGRVIDAVSGQGIEGVKVYDDAADGLGSSATAVTNASGDYALVVADSTFAIRTDFHDPGAPLHVGGCRHVVRIPSGKKTEVPPILMMPRPKDGLPKGMWGILAGVGGQIDDVVAGSTAERAGLKAGDRVVKADGLDLSETRGCLLSPLLVTASSLDLHLETGRRIRVPLRGPRR